MQARFLLSSVLFSHLFLSLSTMTVDVLCRHAAWTFSSFPLSPLSQATFGFPANMNSNSLMYFSFSFFLLFSFASFAQIPTVSVRTTQSLSSNIHHHSINPSSGLKDRSISSLSSKLQYLPCPLCAYPRVRARGVSGHDVLRICCVGIPIKTTMSLRLQLVSWSS